MGRIKKRNTRNAGSANSATRNDTSKVSLPNKRSSRFLCSVCKKKSVFRKPGAPAVCNQCQTTVRKLAVGLGSRAHTCDWCGKSFQNQSLMEEHYSDSKECRPYICQCCGCSFSFVEELAKHSEGHADAPVITFECESCSTQFRTTGKLQIMEKEEDMEVAKERNDVFDEIIDYGEQEMETDDEADDDRKRLCVCHQCRSLNRVGGDKKKCELVTNEMEAEGMNGDEVFPCHSCDEKFVSETFLIAHVKRLHSYRYSCPICNMSFGKIGLLAQHSQMHESYCLRKFCCKICNVSHEKFYLLEAHLKEHFQKAVTLCVTCGQVFENPNFRDIHLLKCCGGDKTDTILDFSGLTIPCRSCDKVFPSQPSLVDHVKECHSGTAYVCSICKKPFQFLWGLSQHYQSHESYCLRNYPCKICKATHKSLFLLESHLKEHFDKFVTLCVSCGKVFESVKSRNAHLVECNGGDRTDMVVDFLKSLLTCGSCNTEFPSQLLLNEHVKECQSGGVFVCTICKTSCKTMKTLMKHYQSHECYCLQKFPCKVCNATHKSLFLLESHLKEHFKRYVALCVSCGHVFQSAANRDGHQRECSGGDNTGTIIDLFSSPFPCHFCDRGFPCQTSFNDHAVKCHLDRHKCLICGKVLNSVVSLSQHCQKHKSYCLWKFACKICNLSHSSIHRLETHLAEHFKKTVHLCVTCGHVFEAATERNSHFLVCRGGDKTDTITHLYKTFEKDSVSI